MTTNDPDQIRANIERTRSNLSEDVNTLAEQMKPGNVARRQAGKMGGAVSNLKDKVMGSASDASHSVGSTMGSATHSMTDTVGSATSTVTGAVGHAPHQAVAKTQGNPLAAGMVAFGVGMLISSLMPASEKERQAADELPVAPDDEDLQLCLTVMYELHYRGVVGVDDDWEWDGDLLQVRGVLERGFERTLRRLAAPVRTDGTVAGVTAALEQLTEPSPRPGLAFFLARRGDLHQFRELLVHRSLYHLKEADPHTWAIPRLHGAPKAALVEIQADEYGGGRPEWVHATLFAQSMRGLGLDDAYGAYLDQVPALSLAAVNAMTMFGLHRRLRGAAVGHLTAYEMTSTQPNRRYAQGLRRLGLDEDCVRYFAEHVEADAVDEQIALRDMAGGLVAQDPGLADDVLLGARTALALDDLVADHLLTSWRNGRSALRSLDLRTLERQHVPA